MKSKEGEKKEKRISSRKFYFPVAKSQVASFIRMNK